MNWSTVSLAAAVFLLLIADVLAFHDVFEPHTVREWLMLAGSVLVVVGLAGVMTRGTRTAGRHG